MSEDIVERARRLRANITQGEWRFYLAGYPKYYTGLWVHNETGSIPVIASPEDDDPPIFYVEHGDSEFIEAAPELVDGLIAEIERLKKLIIPGWLGH